MGKKDKGYSPVTIASDAVGIAFFVVANTIIFLGEVTDLFVRMGLKHGGTEFVYEYLCPFAKPVILAFYGDQPTDLFAALLIAEFAVILGAIFYRWIVFLILRLIAFLLV